MIVEENEVFGFQLKNFFVFFLVCVAYLFKKCFNELDPELKKFWS